MHNGRFALSAPALFACLLFISATASARHRGMTDEESAASGFALEPIHLEAGVIAPAIANLTFEADGKRDGQPAHLTASHLATPMLFIAEMRPTVRFLHHFLAGFQVSFMTGSLDPAGAREAASMGVGPDVGGIGAGLHAGAVYTRGHFDLRGELDAGARQMFTTASALDEGTCHHKGTAYPCQPTATATQFYLRPRAAVGIHLGSMVTIGGFAGIDISPSGGVGIGHEIGWSAGGFFAIHSPWSTEVMHLDDMARGDPEASVHLE